MAEQNVNEPMANEEEKKYTDKDVDAIIDKKFAAWQAKQDKAIAEAVAKVEEAHKLAQMTEKEKLDHEREAERQELAALRAEKAHAEMVSGVDLFVHRKAVQQRILRYQPQVSCDQYGHMAHLDALGTALSGIFLHLLQVDVHLYAVRRIPALRHDVRHDLIHRVCRMNSLPIRSVHKTPPSIPKHYRVNILLRLI